MTTPPGWYPEPGHTGNGPALERWWDGTEWTEYTRSAPPPAADVLSAGHQGYPPYPGAVAPGGTGSGGRGGKTAVGVIAAAVLLAGVVGGAVALTGHNSGVTDKAGGLGPSPSAAPFGPDGGAGGSGGSGGGFGGPSAAPPALPSADPGFALDALDGIQIPVPAGWKGQTQQFGTAGVTVGTYACPGDTSKTCVRGGVFSMPAESIGLTSTTAEAAAKEDISKNAQQSYGDNIYGGITSHQEVKSQKVTVAGEQGYLVRWKVVTKKGDDGYVQSVVFPSPGGSNRLVLVRYGFDINSKAPKATVMDEITKGIKTAGSTNGTGV
jgi:hypothetical protein